MNYLGVNYEMQYVPALDPEFIPFGQWADAYRKGAKKPIAIAIERNEGYTSVWNTFIHGTEEMFDADYRYVERYVKFLLWAIGGFRISVCGCTEIAARLQKAYSEEGTRAFDCDFFEKVYERKLEILDLPLESCPAPNECPQPIGGHLDG